MNNNLRALDGISKFCLLSFVFLALLVPQTIFAGPIRDMIRKHKDTQGLEDSESSAKVNPLPPGVNFLSDIPYGNDDKQRFDVYMPANKVNGAPVIFMVHGGAWKIGDKGSYSVVKNKVDRWVTLGFIFISVNYRLVPAVSPLEQVEDIVKAFTAAQTKVVELGGDPSKFILMGHSAGAHLVSLMVANGSKSLIPGTKSWLGSIFLDSAAFDVVKIMEGKHYGFYDDAFGKNPILWQLASPFHQLSSAVSPILSVCSAKRDDACPQAMDFTNKAISFGINAKVLEQNFTHKAINEDLGLNNTYTQAVESFIGSLDNSVQDILLH